MGNPIRSMIPASSDEDDSNSDSSSSSSGGDEPTRSGALDQKRRLNEDEGAGDSSEDDDSSDDESTDSKVLKYREDEDKIDDSDDEDEEEGETNNDNPASLSLQERLHQKEMEQSTMGTTTALKDQRERRNKALPLAKERLQAFRRNQQQQKTSDAKDEHSSDRRQAKTKKSKHAPTEVSSRRRHNKTLNERGIGVTIGANRYQARDPRMSNLSGHLDQEQFEHHFGFLQKVQSQEMTTLKRKMKALRQTGKKGQRVRNKLGISADDTVESLQEQLQTIQQTVATQNQQKLERNAKKAVKQKLQSQVAEGTGGVYYPKRQEMKKMQMEAKIAEIQKQKGKQGLDKYLGKRRKKQKSRDAKRMKSMEPFV